MRTITILKPIKIIAAKTTFSAVEFFLFVGMLTNTVLGIGDSAQGAVINAASCSYDDVSAAVDSASAGDTIIVPSGSCTWSSTLSITKGITLQGAGIGNAIISGNNLGLNAYGLPIPMIKYNPSSDSQVFRITGFTFNITNQGCISVRTNSEPTTGTVRIDNNRFTNVPATSGYGGCVLFNWGCFGVFDNNIVDDVYYPFRVGNSRTSDGQDAWASYSDGWGTVDNIYVEDNIISTHGNGGIMTDGDQGGRYAFRYNTITISNAAWPLFDAHGGRGGLWGTMLEEIYGNTINCGGHQIFLVSHRGGRGTAHHNNIINSDSPIVNIYNNTGCPPTPYYDRQLINNSYFFQNRENTTGSFIPDYIGSNTCGDVVENGTFWMDNPSCVYPSTCSNITTGTGCGPLANRPTSCTAGVGYWATDQSCTDLTGMTGTNPANPISGTLYKCTATDTWTAWYTPLTYPHPLRGESGPNTISPTRSNPDNFTLQQNYPNPFNPSTTIEYSVAKPCNVQIIIYNQLGQEIYTLVNERKPAGEYNVRWDGRDAKGNELASGVYFYRLTAGKQVGTKKMLYLR